MADKKIAPKKERLQVLRREELAPTYYANYFGVLATKGDVRLRFGQVQEASPEKLEANVVADVYLSPDHLLDYIQLLVSKLPQYAQMFPDTAWSAMAMRADASVRADDKTEAE